MKQIILGDCLNILNNMESNLVDLVITSPPYFQQRDYGNGNTELGSENEEQDYLNNLLVIFAQCVRVAKPNAIIVFNIGDKYTDGSLSLLPYKFAIQVMQQHKLFLINQITWSKLNPTPRQDKKKLIQATEPFFVFAKSKNYHFDTANYLKHLDDLNKKQKSTPTEKMGKQYFQLIETADLSSHEKEIAKKSLQEAILLVRNGQIDSFRMKIRGIHKEAYGGMEGGRNNQIRQNGFTIIKILGNKLKKDLIESPVETLKNNEHPAIYPLYIVQELIKLMSKENDLILDPFCGSGTTCLAAKNLNCDYIGIEINPAYVQIAQNRLEQNTFNYELFV